MLTTNIHVLLHQVDPSWVESILAFSLPVQSLLGVNLFAKAIYYSEHTEHVLQAELLISICLDMTTNPSKHSKVIFFFTCRKLIFRFVVIFYRSYN